MSFLRTGPKATAKNQLVELEPQGIVAKVDANKSKIEANAARIEATQTRIVAIQTRIDRKTQALLQRLNVAEVKAALTAVVNDYLQEDKGKYGSAGESRAKKYVSEVEKRLQNKNNAVEMLAIIVDDVSNVGGGVLSTSSHFRARIMRELCNLFGLAYEKLQTNISKELMSAAKLAFNAGPSMIAQAKANAIREFFIPPVESLQATAAALEKVEVLATTARDLRLEAVRLKREAETLAEEAAADQSRHSPKRR